MVIFNSYVKLPEGTSTDHHTIFHLPWPGPGCVSWAPFRRAGGEGQLLAEMASKQQQLHYDFPALQLEVYCRFKMIPSGYVKIAIESGHFIVSFPIENGDFP